MNAADVMGWVGMICGIVSLILLLVLTVIVFRRVRRDGLQ